jgi:hypothetical protein
MPYIWQTFWNNIQTNNYITMEGFDQKSLYPSLKHPETNISRPGFEPPSSADGDSTKELSRQLTLFVIWNIYIT